jgi:hypothetical protein
MVSRIQNRNNGYSENLFSKNTSVENNALNSIEGATALKLEEQYEEKINEEVIAGTKLDTQTNDFEIEQSPQTDGISIESASYIENNISNELTSSPSENNIKNSTSDEEHTPQLFSSDNENDSENIAQSESEITETQNELLDQDLNEEEDFEIPAFLRKQKF